MKYLATVKPSGRVFDVSDEKSILESALDANVGLAYSCRNGECGVCRARLLKGAVKQLSVSNGLTDEDKENGYILTCQAIAESDLEFEASYFPELDDIKTGIYPAKVDELNFIGDILILKLRMPPTVRFHYLAGQYIQLIINGERRSYSIANVQAVYQGIELHIRYVVNGLFSEYLFNRITQNSLVRFEGPLGSFFLRGSDAPVIFLAGGTGFAPVKSMIEELIDKESKREIYLYWGVGEESHFYTDLPEAWLQAGYIKEYIPVISGNSQWDGRTGLVHEAVLHDFSELRQFEVYACGSISMIKAAKTAFLSAGLLGNNFYSDAFVSSN